RALLNAQLYRELKQRSAELEVASRHKSEFLASMSHELRTPLNAVLGFSEVLLEQMFGEVNERQEEYLRDIHGSGRHLLELLNEILDLSKVEAGRMELEYSTFELRALLDNTVAMLRERAAAHGIELHVEVGPDIDQVFADELRLKQVVLNLMTNAVKFTGDGGSVVVRAVRAGSEIEITVTDTGIGVPVEDRERIFESFQQGGRGPSQEEGTGLGLTLSRRIVELLGGRMWLASEVGAGSTFGFSLRSREAADQPRSGRPPVGDVVIIEDDRPSLDLMTAYLSGAALRVTAVGDGQSGLDAVRRVRPAAVLLDIRLPGIDGWAVLQALKAEPETSSIPVIVVSIVDERARGAALGAAAYLVKPVSRDALLDTLVAAGALSAPEAEGELS
ncbi:MAG TPA: ATP-binding protein, partial [Kribbella sp.]|uniref:ATP-binding response regulator n=1 Tax=Kribbella sp. TaxID=1871183 RepID=UPI002D76B168